jgi:hypothetical protein
MKKNKFPFKVKIPHKEISYKYLSATNTITAQPED